MANKTNAILADREVANTPDGEATVAVDDRQISLLEVLELNPWTLKPIRIASIRDPGPLREAAKHDDMLERLTEDIERFGQLHPIIVRPAPDDERSFVVIDGAIRLAACTRLNQQEINCVVISDPAEAELVGLSANLRRAEFNELERSVMTARFLELWLVKEAQVAPISVRGRPEGRGNRGGIRSAARALSIDRTAAQRAVRIAAIDEGAQGIARSSGLSNNGAALRKIAAEKTPAAQQARARQLATPSAAATETSRQRTGITKRCATLCRAWERCDSAERSEFMRLHGLSKQPLQGQLH